MATTMPAPRRMTCPRCARVIEEGAQVERFGMNPTTRTPTYAHGDPPCQPAGAAERLLLTGNLGGMAGAPAAAWDAPEVVHRGTTTGPARVVGQVDTPTAPPDRPGPTVAPAAEAARPVTAESVLSSGQFAELKEVVSTRAQGFAANVLARKIGELADAKAAELAPAAVNQAAQKMANAGSRAVAKAVHEATEQLAGRLAPAVEETCERFKGLTTQANDAFRAALARMDEARRSTLVVQGPAGTTVMPEDERFHVAFPEALKLSAAGFNVFMVGPTGSGKSHIAEQVSRALGLPFGLINGTAGTTEIELLGRGYPNVMTGQNVYWPSEFVTLYEGGGVFCADELDAMDPNLVLKLNGAIAQGYCTVPHRPEKPRAVRHPHFVFIATANTWGGGANRQYCGRNQMDEATLDRLRCGSVVVDYDPALERAAACPEPDLYEVLSGWREGIMRGGFHRILSTRFVAGAYRLAQLGYTVDEIGDKLTGGWSERERRAVLGR